MLEGSTALSAALCMNVDWHDYPDLYSSLALLAGITTIVAIIHEFRRRKPGWWKRTKPLDGVCVIVRGR